MKKKGKMGLMTTDPCSTGLRRAPPALVDILLGILVHGIADQEGEEQSKGNTVSSDGLFIWKESTLLIL